jgi:hypothetical protein
MRIDRSHRSWMLATLGILAVALAAYVSYPVTSRPSGGSVPGILYGAVGYGMMLFAALLGVRKKVPVWRLGRGQTWMRGHIWLGLLTLPMILFHSGFTLGGPLTSLLMVLLYLVFLSGVAGAAIQHFVPGLMTSMVPLETIYEEIPHVREQLRGDADVLVRALFTQPDAVPEPVSVALVAGAEKGPARPESEEMIEMEVEEREYAAGVYYETIRPFLVNPDDRGSILANADRARIFFDAMKRKLPVATYGVLADLESICDEERQQTRQKRLYVLLHGWLLVHVPLAVALVVLGGVHALVALRY